MKQKVDNSPFQISFTAECDSRKIPEKLERSICAEVYIYMERYIVFIAVFFSRPSEERNIAVGENVFAPYSLTTIYTVFLFYVLYLDSFYHLL